MLVGIVALGLLGTWSVVSANADDRPQRTGTLTRALADPADPADPVDPKGTTLYNTNFQDPLLINCTLVPRDPIFHPGEHDYIDSYGSVGCNFAVMAIFIRVEMLRNQFPIAFMENNSSGSYSVSAQTYSSCVEGWYQTYAKATVTFPFGVEPPTATAEFVSREVQVVCI